MRFISKRKRCRPFDKYRKTKKTNEWDRFDSGIKFTLHRHLWREQKGLCVYCQQAIPEKTSKDSISYHHPSHIEHIRPKSKYKHLTYAYKNLSVACNGFNCSMDDEKGEFCEYKKKDEYNEKLFLNPVEVEDIETYFIFDIDGNIEANPKKSPLQRKKAHYMIEILDLQNPNLKKMRCEQIDIFLESLEQGFTVEELLSRQNLLLPGFYSMLKYFFM